MQLLKALAALVSLMLIAAATWLAIPVTLCLAQFPYVCALLLQGAQILSPVVAPERWPFSNL